MAAIRSTNYSSLRFLILLTTIYLSLPANGAAQCKQDQRLSEVGNVVRKLDYSGKKTAEVELIISASVPGGSWELSGAEAAVLTVFVDGKYNQDVMLFAGSQNFDYKILLGRLNRGSHRISVSLNKKHSAKNAQIATIATVEARPLEIRDGRQQLAVANAPFLYARADTVDRFSDIPLVSYYESISKPDDSYGVRYTTIFTNEDGGTQTAALMARWGRATDIEWVYEVWFRDGKRISEIYQGANHKTTDFRGTRVLGDHPMMSVATDNNNFADNGCSPLRFAPLPQAVDLSARSRESVMDANPWTHRVMAEEAIREGRVDANKMGPNVIDDPRNYLYVDAFIETASAAIAVEITTNDGQPSRSDLGDARLRIRRPGYQRIAVRLPKDVTMKSVRILCFGDSDSESSSNCGQSHLISFMRLANDYTPATAWRRGE